MAIQEAIFERCTTQPILARLIGNRCYFEQLPEGAAGPALVISIIPDGFKIEVYAGDEAQTAEVLEAIRLTWGNYRGVEAGISIIQVYEIEATKAGISFFLMYLEPEPIEEPKKGGKK